MRGGRQARGVDTHTRRSPRQTHIHLLGERLRGDEAAHTVSSVVRNLLLLLLLLDDPVKRSVEHPVPERDRTKRGPRERLMFEIKWRADIISKLRLLLRLRLFQNRIQLLMLHNHRPNHVFLGEEPPRCALCLHHAPELAPEGLLEIVPVPLLDDVPALEDVHEVAGADLGEVVCDDDCCSVCAPSFHRFEYEDPGRRIQRGRCLVCNKISRQCQTSKEKKTHQESEHSDPSTSL